MEQQLRIVVADDDRRTRAGLRALLATYPDWAVVGEASNGQEAITQIEQCRPDVVLLDLHMPLLDGLQATTIIKERWPGIAILILTMDSSQRSAALAAGADAFVSKADATDQVVTTLRMMHAAGDEPKGVTTGDPAA